jgi:hypothetical protein
MPRRPARGKSCPARTAGLGQPFRAMPLGLGLATLGSLTRGRRRGKGQRRPARPRPGAAKRLGFAAWPCPSVRARARTSEGPTPVQPFRGRARPAASAFRRGLGLGHARQPHAPVRPREGPTPARPRPCSTSCALAAIARRHRMAGRGSTLLRASPVPSARLSRGPPRRAACAAPLGLGLAHAQQLEARSGMGEGPAAAQLVRGRARRGGHLGHRS